MVSLWMRWVGIPAQRARRCNVGRQRGGLEEDGLGQLSRTSRLTCSGSGGGGVVDEGFVSRPARRSTQLAGIKLSAARQCPHLSCYRHQV